MGKVLNHIVCVDDESDILEVTKLSLETVGGYKVSICSNGADAIDVALKESPDLMLVDVMMPEMDGPATLKALREHEALKNIPVVFMTARVQPAEIQEYMDMGAAGVVAKPYDPMTLPDQILDIWNNSDE